MELPIIFPFTYLDGTTLELIHKALGQFEILQLSPGLVPGPVAKAGKQGKVVLRFQQKADPDRLEKLLEDYLNWAGMFGRDGRNMALFYQQTRGLPPLVDDNAPSRIRSQVKQMTRDQSPETSGQDPLIQACLTLAMAQDYDQQQQEITGRLAAITNMEKELYASLKGEDDITLSGSQVLEVREDQGAVKTSARLVAWALLVAGPRQVPGLWVTTSQAVIEYMVEKAGVEFAKTVPLKNGLGPAALDELAAGPGPNGEPSVGALDQVEPPSLVLFRFREPSRKFPFSRLEGKLTDNVPGHIALGWLTL